MENWETIEGQLQAAIAANPPLAEPVRLLSPVPEGGKILCIGLNYRDHAIESGMAIPSEPVVFNKLSGTLCGPEDVVPLPACSQQVDFEAELVLVIGKRAWQVSEEQAEQHIFGYTCGHDVSARDWQIGRPGGQWLLGKSFPGFAPIGPALIPRTQIADPCQLSIALRINGETFQQSSTKQLIFSPRKLISFLSQCFALEVGDIIFTGTPPGVGMARKPPRFLQSGDVCEVEIEHLGVLRNRFE
ncbi:MAG: fumarylacetoacetate hydrolase family protein [Planctomycetales bacterium]|nr:fumarylacetoacetate hydrolase family protein [Planctomycetales bacterium]